MSDDWHDDPNPEYDAPTEKCPFLEREVGVELPGYIDTCTVEQGIHCHGFNFKKCIHYIREIERRQWKQWKKEFCRIDSEEILETEVIRENAGGARQ